MKRDQSNKTKHTGGRPTKLDATVFKQAIDLYLSKCIEEKKIPFIQDFCLYIDISTDTFRRYEQFNNYAAPAKRLRLASELAIINAGISGTKPIMSIFLLKALFGYKEGQNIDITSDGKPVGVVQLPARTK